MIYSLKIITFFSFFVATSLNCASEQNKTVPPRPVPDSIVLVFGNSYSLRDVLHLARTDTYHYDIFCNAIIKNTLKFKESFWGIKENYQLCTKMLISSALMTDHADTVKNKADKKKYAQRFHALWRYSSAERNDQVCKIVEGDDYPYSIKSAALDKKIKISLYAGSCVSSGMLKNALSRFLVDKEEDLLLALTNREGYEGNWIEIMYINLGLGFIKKMIGLLDIDLKAYRYNDIPFGQKLVCSAYKRRDEETIRFLLDKGVRNTLDFQRSISHGGVLQELHCFEDRNLNVLRLLLQRDYFNQEIKNEILEKNFYNDDAMVFDLLLEYGADKSSLSVESLCAKGYVQELESLKQKDPDFLGKLTNNSICYCFINALCLPDLKTLAFLCAQPNIDINMHPNSDYNENKGIFFFALDKGKFEGAKILLERGANIHTEEIKKRYIDGKWNQETVNFLFENGFNTTELKKAKIKNFLINLRETILLGAGVGVFLLGAGSIIVVITTILINGIQSTWNGTGIT